MPEKNYTKREQDHFFGEMFKRMDKQDASLARIEDQTTQHNHRMTKIEDKVSDYHEVKAQVSEVSKWKIEFMSEIKGMKRIMVILVIILPSLISTIFILYINHLRESIKEDVSSSVVSTLEEKYNLKISQ